MKRHWYLDEINILDKLDQNEVMLLLNSSRIHTFSKGKYIFQSEDDAGCLYLLLKGKVKIFLVNETGEEVLLSIRYPNNIFGLSSIAAEGKRMASAMVLETAVCRIIPKDVFFGLLKSNKDLSLQIIKILGRRLHQYRLIVKDLLTKKVEIRLATMILKLAQQFGKPIDSGVLIDVKLTQEDIGNMISARRQTVNRILNEFAQKKLIYKKSKRIVVADLHGLEKLVESDILGDK